MSMHKIPLTPLEEEGLLLHGLPIGTPSQRSDTFRQGVAWGIGEAKRLAEENEKLWMTFVKTADVLGIDTEAERKTPGAPSGVFIREIERLRKDAERYRWFRVNENWRDSGPFDEFYEADLDAAIDAARGAK